MRLLPSIGQAHLLPSRVASLRRWLYPSRLVEAPRVLVDDRDSGDEDSGRVALRGVVCGICAARTRAALERVPGVESVEVDLAGSEARVRYTASDRPTEAAMQQALDRVVVGIGARRWIEHAVHRWRTRRSGA